MSTTRNVALMELEDKALGMLALFESLPEHLQMDGLDIFQGVVTSVVKRITQGRVSSVKFVPVECAAKTIGTISPCSSYSEHSPIMPDSPPPVKSEPVDPVWDCDNVLAASIHGSHSAISGHQSEEEEEEEEVAPMEAEEEEEPEGMQKVEIKEELKENTLNKTDMTSKKTIEINKTSSITTRGRKKPGPKPRSQKGNGGEEGEKQKRVFRCQQCSYSSLKRSHLQQHMAIHNALQKFACDECGKEFTANSSLKRHKMAHQGLKPHVCTVCGKRFVDMGGLRIHLTVHTGERLYQCDQCPKQYTNSANLSRHKRVHTGEMPYDCKLCGVKYRDLSSLKLHTLKHTGEKPYLCEVCNKQFKTSSDFKRHERTHTGERNYKCKECGKTFIQGWHLKQHQRMHEDYRPFHCTICDKSFRTKASYQHHQKGHAGIKDFICNICHKAFSTKKYLRDHQVIHTSAKPFKCKVCGTEFNQVSNLKRHERIHSDEKRYKCRYCSKAFKYINSWRYHEGIHTGEMMQCDKCGLEFRSTYGIKNHQCDPSQYEVNLKRAKAKNESKLSAKIIISEEQNGREGEKNENSEENIDDKIFKCKACGIEFSSMINLKHHLKSHLGGNGVKIGYSRPNRSRRTLSKNQLKVKISGVIKNRKVPNSKGKRKSIPGKEKVIKDHHKSRRENVLTEIGKVKDEPLEALEPLEPLDLSFPNTEVQNAEPNTKILETKSLDEAAMHRTDGQLQNVKVKLEVSEDTGFTRVIIESEDSQAGYIGSVGNTPAVKDDTGEKGIIETINGNTAIVK